MPMHTTGLDVDGCCILASALVFVGSTAMGGKQQVVYFQDGARM